MRVDVECTGVGRYVPSTYSNRLYLRAPMAG